MSRIGHWTNALIFLLRLDANEGQLDFPVLYASGRAGWADQELDGPRADLSALFDLIVSHVESPEQQQKVSEPFLDACYYPWGGSIYWQDFNGAC